MPREKKSAGTRSQMRPTLVRFGPQLLAEVKAEAPRTGISDAQYVREAVVARIAYTNGLLDADPRPDRLTEALRENERLRSERSAVMAESKQARAQARYRRAQAQETRRERHTAN